MQYINTLCRKKIVFSFQHYQFMYILCICIYHIYLYICAECSADGRWRRQQQYQQWSCALNVIWFLCSSKDVSITLFIIISCVFSVFSLYVPVCILFHTYIVWICFSIFAVIFFPLLRILARSRAAPTTYTRTTSSYIHIVWTRIWNKINDGTLWKCFSYIFAIFFDSPMGVRRNTNVDDPHRCKSNIEWMIYGKLWFWMFCGCHGFFFWIWILCLLYWNWNVQNLNVICVRHFG